MMKKGCLIVLILFVIALAALVLFVSSAADRGDRTAAGGPGEPFEAITIIRANEASALDIEVNAWEAPFGVGPLGRGRVRFQLVQGTPVQVTRRAWHEEEERYYYLVQHDGSSGWIPAPFVQLQQTP